MLNFLIFFKYTQNIYLFYTQNFWYFFVKNTNFFFYNIQLINNRFSYYTIYLNFFYFK